MFAVCHTLTKVGQTPPGQVPRQTKGLQTGAPRTDAP